jgi:hypothetical protein
MQHSLRKVQRPGSLDMPAYAECNDGHGSLYFMLVCHVEHATPRPELEVFFARYKYLSG